MKTILDPKPGILQDRVVVRMTELAMADVRARNELIWSNPGCWRLGFYFGEGDTRLWVPRRCACGAPRDADRVINFRHPVGRTAFRILMLGYATAALLAVAIAAIALGARW
jgi:uncharacterized membrane protein